MRSATLDGVLSRIRSGTAGNDPDLARRLDAAFSKHLGWLRHRCRDELRGSPEQEVEEALQQALLIAWTRLPELTEPRAFGGWLAAILANTCANARRKMRDALVEDGVVEVADGAPSPLALLAHEERAELVRAAAAAALDPLEQELVELRYVHGYSREQAGELLGLDVDEVRVTLQRCGRRLRREIHARLEALGAGTSFLRSS